MKFIKRHRYWFLGIAAAPIIILSFIYHDDPIIFFLGTLELILIAIVVNVFVFAYSRRNWRANPYGRALMYSKVSLATLANLSLVTATLGPDWEYRATVRALLFGGILIAQLRLLHLLFMLGKEHDPERNEEILEAEAFATADNSEGELNGSTTDSR